MLISVGSWEIAGGPPRAGLHYPRDTSQFYAWFPTERAAREYLTAVRFQERVTCPRCDGQVGAPRGERWWCPRCRRWFTVTTGTLLQRTKVPFRTWLEVAWQLVDTKVGVSALSIARITGLDYRSAWGLLHKLRRAMEQSGRERLHGEVEFDETYVGGVEEGAGGRSRGKKQPVAVACERVSETAMGRIRLARLPDASALAIADFLEQNVEPGSILISDNWTSYVPALDEFAKRGLAYEHRPTTLRGSDERAHRVHPHVHRVAALLERWMLGTHQGSITGEYLDAYLDEFVFRFNRRHSKNRGLIFWRLVCALTSTGPFPRTELARRTAELDATDRQHAEEVNAWRRSQRAALQRERRRRAAEADGRTVRPYRRKATELAEGDG